MTHSQKRGYIILTTVLAVLVVVMLVMQMREGNDKMNNRESANLKQFEQQAAQYEDSLVAQTATQDSLRYQSYHNKRNTHFSNIPPSTSHTTTTNPHPTTAATTYTHKTNSLVFDLNTADTLDLQQLYGIGPVFARRIVKYRTLLGGFCHKEQLKEVYGFTPELYAQVESHLTLSSSHPTQININTATLDDLKRHPYLNYYQAKAIVLYRQKGGRFETPHDLLKINLIDQETYQKIQPYIKTN